MKNLKIILFLLAVAFAIGTVPAYGQKLVLWTKIGMDAKGRERPVKYVGAISISEVKLMQTNLKVPLAADAADRAQVEAAAKLFVETFSAALVGAGVRIENGAPNEIRPVVSYSFESNKIIGAVLFFVDGKPTVGIGFSQNADNNVEAAVNVKTAAKEIAKLVNNNIKVTDDNGTAARQ